MSENTPTFGDSTERRPLRIVFEHTRGPYPGLLQIMGLTSELIPDAGDTLPSGAEGFEALDRLIDFASLIKVTRTYALYRELPRDDGTAHFDSVIYPGPSIYIPKGTQPVYRLVYTWTRVPVPEPYQAGPEVELPSDYPELIPSSEPPYWLYDIRFTPVLP